MYEVSDCYKWLYCYRWLLGAAVSLAAHQFTRTSTYLLRQLATPHRHVVALNHFVRHLSLAVDTVVNLWCFRDKSWFRLEFRLIFFYTQLKRIFKSNIVLFVAPYIHSWTNLIYSERKLVYKTKLLHNSYGYIIYANFGLWFKYY